MTSPLYYVPEIIKKTVCSHIHCTHARKPYLTNNNDDDDSNNNNCTTLSLHYLASLSVNMGVCAYQTSSGLTYPNGLGQF